MSFDEIQIPLRIGFGSAGGPTFATEIVTIAGGYERRNQLWSGARRQFDASTGLRTQADIATLISFFHARAGRARGFRLKDWSDFTSASDGISAPSSTNQQIGVGNGSQTVFQIVKNYTSGGITHQRTIKKLDLNSDATIALNGATLASGYAINANTGEVTFAAAPSSGTIITAGFTFDVPVRFDTDTLSLAHDAYKGAATHIPLIEIRV